MVLLKSFSVGYTAVCLASFDVGYMEGYLGSLAEKESTAVHLGYLAGMFGRVMWLGSYTVGNTEVYIESMVGALEDDIVG